MGHDGAHGYGYYKKIWFYLMILLVISILGPELGIFWVTIITAFGIAIIKAGMVAAYFMHLNIEKKFIWGLLVGALLFLVGLFAGLYPDITNPTGTLWKKCSAFDAKNIQRFRSENTPLPTMTYGPDFVGGNDPAHPVTGIQRKVALPECETQRF